MIELPGPWSGKVKILDASLKWLRTPIQRALESEQVVSLRPGQNYVASGLEKLPIAVRTAKQKNAKQLLLISGPTPVDAKRVPASCVILPVDVNDAPSSSSVETLVSLVGRSLVDQKTLGEHTHSELALWRDLKLSCEASGEGSRLDSGGQIFEALLAGCEPNWSECRFWSLIRQEFVDDLSSFEILLARMLSEFTAWFSPYTGASMTTEDAIQVYQEVQKHWQSNKHASHCYGAQYWNHPSIAATFSGKGGSVTFHETQEETISAALKSKGHVLSWAGRTDVLFETACVENNIPLLRIEDGFLRSVGLGAGLARGAMLAVDDLGIYYDPSRPSRLQVLLNEYDLSESELDRAKRLVDVIKTARVSKYNFGKSKSYTFPIDRQKILVPGQVADDAAIRKSMSATIDCVNTPNVNLDLLKLARKRNPGAYLIFKPHPDVETGLRKGKLTHDQALQYADHIAEDANIIDLIEAIDIVETFSSLSGFEALLRGKRVVVHGAPFYAGWGLCEDLTEIEGRQRSRSLPELVYLALVQYARTIDPVTLLPCTPEFLVTRLTEQRSNPTHLIQTAVKRHASWLGRKLGI